jgi:hypothetical protein
LLTNGFGGDVTANVSPGHRAQNRARADARVEQGIKVEDDGRSFPTVDSRAPIMPPTKAARVIGITSSFGQRRRRASTTSQASPTNNASKKKNPCA